MFIEKNISICMKQEDIFYKERGKWPLQELNTWNVAKNIHQGKYS